MSAGHSKVHKSSIPVSKKSQKDPKLPKSASVSTGGRPASSSSGTSATSSATGNDVENDPIANNENVNLNAQNSDSLVSSMRGTNDEAPRSTTALSTSSDSSSSSSVTTSTTTTTARNDSISVKLKSKNKNLQATKVNKPRKHITQNASRTTASSAEVWLDEKGASLSQRMKNDSMADSERRHDEMEKQIKELEAQLSLMGGLIEKREKLMQDANEEAKQKQESLQGLLNDQENLLISHGIDPATGERVCLDEGKIETTKKFTKKKVQEMREKLKQMSEKTQSCLSDVENTLSDITELEQASERARPSSPETCDMLKELGKNNEIFKMDLEIPQQPLQTRNFNNDIDEYTQEKFGSQFFLTDGDSDMA
ncbi:unnamed protein product [Lymnaea stagnalis]|uniref:Uncharacterized protein n=1 Tax=Lymnaea stagnalis TaxID=6523 RepID=A0AAV2IKY1_LYMST